MSSDLTTPCIEFQFPGLEAGDCRGLCLGRWVGALDAGFTPSVVLQATHASACEFIDIEVMDRHAWRFKDEE